MSHGGIEANMATATVHVLKRYFLGVVMVVRCVAECAPRARNSRGWEPSFWNSARRNMSSASAQSAGCMCELMTQSGEATHACWPINLDSGPAGSAGAAAIVRMKRTVKTIMICWICIVPAGSDFHIPCDHSKPICVGFNELFNCAFSLKRQIYASLRGCGGRAYTENCLDRRRIPTYTHKSYSLPPA